MHNLYFVIHSPEEDEIVEDMRNDTSVFLDDNNFTATGMWGWGKSDWYHIGGRWSGVLNSVNPNNVLKELAPKMKKLLEINKDNFLILLKGNDIKLLEKYLNETIEGKESTLYPYIFTPFSDLLNDKWKELGGTGTFPYLRGAGTDYIDDSKILTKEILQYLKSQYGDCEVCNTSEQEEMLIEDLDEDHIGWNITVVDYHE